MGKGRHKGAPRRFTNFAAESEKAEKEKKEMEWRKKRGELPSSDEEESGSEKSDSEESGSSSEESSSEEEGEKVTKTKGVEHLIETSNPNRAIQKTKKVSEIDVSKSKGPDLTRRQKEEMAKQHYQAMHAQGKTEQARADMARLALIRKKREEAEQKRLEALQAKEPAAGSSAEKSKGKSKK